MTDYISQINNPNTLKFAEACYGMNTRDELQNALENGYDPIDCDKWAISREDWEEAVTAALNQMTEDQ